VARRFQIAGGMAQPIRMNPLMARPRSSDVRVSPWRGRESLARNRHAKKSTCRGPILRKAPSSASMGRIF